jgi:hypothetical protein
MWEGINMKRAISLLIIALAASVPAWCDSIPTSNYVSINGAGGSVTYNSNSPSIVGLGTTYDGGTYNYQASGTPIYGGRFATGSLTVSTPNFSLEGSLSKIFFNPKTGLMQGAFIGQLREDGTVIHIYHSVFYETVNLGNDTNVSGHLVFSTAPEPGSMELLTTGLVGILGVVLRRKSVAKQRSDCDL